MESYWSQKPQKQHFRSFSSFCLTIWIIGCSDCSSMLTCSNTGRVLVKNRRYSFFVDDFRKEYTLSNLTLLLAADLVAELLGADLAAELLAVDLAAVSCWELTWRLNCWQLTWRMNCWQLTWWLNCWELTWWLNWVFCVTCYRLTCCRSYSVPWVLKQVEAPAKQDHFRCCSASKTVNVKTFTANTLFPPSNGKVPDYQCWPLSCWLQGTRLFHFRLDESAVLYGFSCSALDLTVSVRCNKAYSHVLLLCCCFFGWGEVLAQHQQNCLYHHLLQTKQPLKWLRKPLNHQKSDRRERSTTMLGWQIVVQIWWWHWHWRVWHLSVTFILHTVLCQGADRSGEQKIYFKKMMWAISKEVVGHSSGRFIRHFGPQYH